MNALIELHDSVILSVTDSRSDISLRLSAILHRSAGRPGMDAGLVYKVELAFTFYDGHLRSALGELPTTLSEGMLEVGGNCLTNTLPFPFALAGSVVFRCVDQGGCRSEIAGAALSIVAVSNEELLERFPGIDQ